MANANMSMYLVCIMPTDQKSLLIELVCRSEHMEKIDLTRRLFIYLKLFEIVKLCSKFRTTIVVVGFMKDQNHFRYDIWFSRCHCRF